MKKMVMSTRSTRSIALTIFTEVNLSCFQDRPGKRRSSASRALRKGGRCLFRCVDHFDQFGGDAVVGELFVQGLAELVQSGTVNVGNGGAVGFECLDGVLVGLKHHGAGLGNAILAGGEEGIAHVGRDLLNGFVGNEDDADVVGVAAERQVRGDLGEAVGEVVGDGVLTTVLLMLAVTKKLNKLMDTVKRGVWDFSVAKPVHRLAGRTFGTIGCGAIARSTIQKAQAFGMNVISYDPFLTQEQVAPLGITLKSMDEVAAESDVISLHLHLNKSTEGMIGADFFRKMKKDAFFINTARGAIVKEDELIAALRDGEIAGAGIDVLCSETVPADHPLIGMDNVILTPHAAWYSEEASLALLTKGAEEVVRGLNGEKLLHPFNGIYYARKVE